MDSGVRDDETATEVQGDQGDGEAFTEDETASGGAGTDTVEGSERGEDEEDREHQRESEREEDKEDTQEEEQSQAEDEEDGEDQGKKTEDGDDKEGEVQSVDDVDYDDYGDDFEKESTEKNSGTEVGNASVDNQKIQKDAGTDVRLEEPEISDIVCILPGSNRYVLCKTAEQQLSVWDMHERKTTRLVTTGRLRL